MATSPVQGARGDAIPTSAPTQHGMDRRTPDLEHQNEINRQAWNRIAPAYCAEQTRTGDDGNDMFVQLIKPLALQLAELQPSQTVLELGSGDGIICRAFARNGAKVVGLDYAQEIIEIARARDDAAGLGGHIDYGTVDLLDVVSLRTYAHSLRDPRERAKITDAPYRQHFADGFDIITVSMTVKSLPDIQPLAEVLPLLLKPNGRVIVIDLHPAFMKPAGNRLIEIFEDEDGNQQRQFAMKTTKYLNVKNPVKSKAVQDQNEYIFQYHRPIWALLDPFFRAGLSMDMMREETFRTAGDREHPQSYHNFDQIPMLLAFRLRHAAVK
ncbi:S-adenosyl-L-methionine-dependent methyltransferase [Teratosphaeria destructans]|uniref:S-adenosyl-L-methionine-dependent methyltransferase n=1 Tax=Teratosphaeria destructans TaxID=418781 RepID=A0A9W7SZ41_9PEZI|nr:S-adenosyl-L-methionine-dependent methyltransferase [Teratosphaeria destructans]